MINTSFDLELLQQQIQLDSAFVSDLEKEISKSLVGQKYMVDRLILGLLAQGHVLLEGMPGLAKTLAIKTLAAAINAKFSRIQFTPDLLPADIIGTMVYNPGQNEFSVRKGPVFANFILADEINRAPAKVQSALLEAMQEKQVTIGKESFKLEEPFLVLATQNPIEQEGTYPLPEAQVDRFMFKIHLNYPEREEERDIIRKFISGETTQTINPVVSIQTIIKARESVKKIYMDEKIENYILDLVFATRNPEKYNIKEVKDLLVFGASPRASIYLAVASKAHAFMQRRGFVLPEDVRNVAKDILRHRIGLSYEAEAENITQDDIIQKIVNAVEVP
ncbi:MAG: MoxR family ATPase [Saprospiraceae bacterium]|nr:MoxR family ATPase [Saprospiraceae bacterium]MBK7523486.1 MoxR family ATPase [Saprospiraceae bacterium]MBK8371525.1 MoxR family ATPase [Saprospiraceae bacterium]MBK8548790.1 MoxR family ATPase [Saprospiraceae bacterium]MBK8818893.1 MoxR family ATPase [Saprospiraceae bacterium]